MTVLRRFILGGVFLLVLLLGAARWETAGWAKVSQVPRMLITDADGVQVDLLKVKVVSQVRVIGETAPRRKVLSALPGMRGKGRLSVDLDAIRQFTVRDAGYSSVVTDMGLRDGEQMVFEVQTGRGDILFEGLTRVGPYSISIKQMRGAVLQYD